MIVEQYDQKFDILSRFTPKLVETEAARADRFVRDLRLDLQSSIRAFRPATQADALRPIVDMSLHERVDISKTSEKGSTL
ncbi:gag-protease polyprotein [Cucumis melo var. makuwa]|uniref:Gag-protease polyprotein n=1 Tax=Cucumis melo var. makuwa TaxID=1194695 RepID=A0A5A7UNG4_CUCMM|nr:gag-protease polyprotein [Cucumis melo var. makuwa]